MLERGRLGFGQICIRIALALAVAGGPVLGANPSRAQIQPQSGVGIPLRGAGDPPARVGRLARLSGTVSFHAIDADRWEPATLNYPVTSGNAFWTQPGGSADVDLGGARARLDQGTEFDIDTLDDQRIAATVSQGHVAFDLRELPQGETAVLRTPRGTITFRQAGRYAVVVGDTQRPTLVTVNEGAADFEGPGVSLQLAAHQTAEISGANPFEGAVMAESPDVLISALISLDRPPVTSSSLGPPPAVLQMTGYDAIADTGSWEQAPDYGRVWYPPVERDWVPYRQGRWDWVAPWGWTWVDDAPWGFAPSHYGRWVDINDRWAWTPEDRGAVYVGRPVYAPALVAFVGVAAGVAVGVGLASAVGWIPLGPREAYRPPYRVSDGYARRVNSGNVTNIANTTINNTTINNITNVQRTQENYVNNRARTVVPAVAMQQSLPVAGRVLPAAQVQQAALIPVAQPQVQPNLSTRGMTPAAAQTMRLPAGPSAGTPLPAAPGPSFRARDPGAPGGGQTGAPAPGRVGGAGPLQAAPVAGLPNGAVRPPGAILSGVSPGISGAPPVPLVNQPAVGRPGPQSVPSLNTASSPGPVIAPRVQPAQAGGGASSPALAGTGQARPPVVETPAQPGGVTPAQPVVGAPARPAIVAPAPPQGRSEPRAETRPAVASPVQAGPQTGIAPPSAAVPQALPRPAPTPTPTPAPTPAQVQRPAAQPVPAPIQPLPQAAPPPQVARPVSPPPQPRPQPAPQVAPPQPRPQPAPQAAPPPPRPQPAPQAAPPQPRPQPAPPPPPQPAPQAARQPPPPAPAPAARPAPGKTCPRDHPNC